MPEGLNVELAHKLTAAGLAMGGMHPVVAIYATFLNRAFDQVLMDVALHRCGVTFVLDRAGRDRRRRRQPQRHVGHVDPAGRARACGCARPATAPACAELLREGVVVDDAPTVLRLPKGPPAGDLEAVGRVGSMDVLVRDGASDVLIVGDRLDGRRRVEVAERLADQGIGVTVVDPRWVKPWDPALVELARDHRLVVCVEDNGRVGGCGSTCCSCSTTSRWTLLSASTASRRSSSTMPSATRSSSGSGSPPRRWRAASWRTSPHSATTPGRRRSRRRLTVVAAWTDPASLA